MSEIEIRCVPMDSIEIRKSEDGSGKIVGHAAIFNSLSADLGGFREMIRPGTFSRAIAEQQDVRALFNHEKNFVLGRTKSGTLQLSEDDRGLSISIDPPNTTVANDLMQSIERGDIDQMSFAFQLAKDGDRWRKEGGESIRELVDVDLFDISPVTYPAYQDTTVAVRSLNAWETSSEAPAPEVTTPMSLAERIQKQAEVNLD